MKQKADGSVSFFVVWVLKKGWEYVTIDKIGER